MFWHMSLIWPSVIFVWFINCSVYNVEKWTQNIIYKNLDLSVVYIEQSHNNYWLTTVNIFVIVYYLNHGITLMIQVACADVHLTNFSLPGAAYNQTHIWNIEHFSFITPHRLHWHKIETNWFSLTKLHLRLLSVILLTGGYVLSGAFSRHQQSTKFPCSSCTYRW